MKNKIVSVGSIAIDELETPKGSHSNIIGGSATFFSIAASKYNPVKVIGIVGTDFPQSGWDLFKKYNIDTDLITVKDGKTFSWGGKYSDDYSTRDTLYTDLGVFENYNPEINQSIDTEYLYLGNIQPSLQLDVINKINKKKRIVSDTMNLWINLDQEGLWEVIKKSDIFFYTNPNVVSNSDISSEDLNSLCKKYPKKLFFIDESYIGFGQKTFLKLIVLSRASAGLAGLVTVSGTVSGLGTESAQPSNLLNFLYVIPILVSINPLIKNPPG